MFASEIQHSLDQSLKFSQPKFCARTVDDYRARGRRTDRIDWRSSKLEIDGLVAIGAADIIEHRWMPSKNSRSRL
jgi:hypothetical protein